MQHGYRVLEPEVVADIVDGEAVIMNLKSGKYFSSEGTGSYCWDAIAAGHAPARIAERLANAYGVAPESVAAAVSRFVDELVAHQLIAPAPSAEARETGALPEPPQGAFMPPVLNVYSDMEDLLMLDPIHDVDAAGWPMPKNEALI